MLSRAVDARIMHTGEHEHLFMVLIADDAGQLIILGVVLHLSKL